jgi:hypothetical protein
MGCIASSEVDHKHTRRRRRRERTTRDQHDGKVTPLEPPVAAHPRRKNPLAQPLTTITTITTTRPPPPEPRDSENEDFAGVDQPRRKSTLSSITTDSFANTRSNSHQRPSTAYSSSIRHGSLDNPASQRKRHSWRGASGSKSTADRTSSVVSSTLASPIKSKRSQPAEQKKPVVVRNRAKELQSMSAAKLVRIQRWVDFSDQGTSPLGGLLDPEMFNEQLAREKRMRELVEQGVPMYAQTSALGETTKMERQRSAQRLPVSGVEAAGFSRVTTTVRAKKRIRAEVDDLSPLEVSDSGSPRVHGNITPRRRSRVGVGIYSSVAESPGCSEQRVDGSLLNVDAAMEVMSNAAMLDSHLPREDTIFRV